MRAPVGWMLVSGLLSAGFGGLILVLAWREEGVPLLAIPITALGLLLTGWGLVEARRPERPAEPSSRPPSVWFLVGLGAILALQFAWCCHWRANNR